MHADLFFVKNCDAVWVANASYQEKLYKDTSVTEKALEDYKDGINYKENQE